MENQNSDFDKLTKYLNILFFEKNVFVEMKKDLLECFKKSKFAMQKESREKIETMMNKRKSESKNVKSDIYNPLLFKIKISPNGNFIFSQPYFSNDLDKINHVKYFDINNKKDSNKQPSTKYNNTIQILHKSKHFSILTFNGNKTIEECFKAFSNFIEENICCVNNVSIDYLSTVLRHDKIKDLQFEMSNILFSVNRYVHTQSHIDMKTDPDLQLISKVEQDFHFKDIFLLLLVKYKDICKPKEGKKQKNTKNDSFMFDPFTLLLDSPLPFPSKSQVQQFLKKNPISMDLFDYFTIDTNEFSVHFDKYVSKIIKENSYYREELLPFVVDVQPRFLEYLCLFSCRYLICVKDYIFNLFHKDVTFADVEDDDQLFNASEIFDSVDHIEDMMEFLFEKGVVNNSKAYWKRLDKENSIVLYSFIFGSIDLLWFCFHNIENYSVCNIDVYKRPENKINFVLNTLMRFAVLAQFKIAITKKNEFSLLKQKRTVFQMMQYPNHFKLDYVDKPVKFKKMTMYREYIFLLNTPIMIIQFEKFEPLNAYEYATNFKTDNNISDEEKVFKNFVIGSECLDCGKDYQSDFIIFAKCMHSYLCLTCFLKYINRYFIYSPWPCHLCDKKNDFFFVQSVVPEMNHILLEK